ncbi:aminotransferase class I/II-fold pyridoxal phosphate-dependent enzyme [Bacillus alkalisoli]|uniref:aminotransferase class I/II-fold pyridoxal phosphate-dependent enzyme n=1 Tax=Bacillus alkalisoli TaxID=2011008 RepID=UPI000C232A1B|nr:aminotransferase class I/II-fold pyridoxal phosphate-dependent enzyme [Bacillus alkalisoli]
MRSLNQKEIPLYTTLLNHFSKSPISGHVPGHKYGSNLPNNKEIRHSFSEILKLDVTEITGLDDLHDPTGAIQDAQILAAELYKADETFFLVNGSTVGNLAMILATCSSGGKVLVQRNCHKSIMNGIELAGADPIFLSPQVHEEIGVPTSISKEQVKLALHQFEDVQAIIITNPNYYGISSSLEAIIHYAHSKKIPVLVDEAHGAHFVVGEPFPKSALLMEADVVVHSAHKTLPALTMGSYLHVKSNLVDKEKVAYYLRMLQSSSPSYPIMASLDIARYYLASFSEQDIKNVNQNIERLVLELDTIEEIEVVGNGKNKDPLKLILRSTTGLSGYELQQKLEEQNVFVELADPLNVLFILPLSHDYSFHDMISRIRKAVHNSAIKPNNLRITTEILFPMNINKLTLNFLEQNVYEVEEIQIDKAVGKISAETIVPYPPGIPVLIKGERISQEVVEYIGGLAALGARFQGADFTKKNTIQIFKVDTEKELQH